MKNLTQDGVVMNKKNYMTVVFEYEDGAEIPKKLTKAFADNVEFKGTKITAISLEDEIIKVEKLEEIVHTV